MYNTNSKRKSMIFSKKKNFFNIFNFFSKGGTLWCQNRQKNFFPFFKNFKNKTQKWLSWDHSNINRNKVRNFGGRSSYPAETARPFTVVRAIMAPPPGQNRVKWAQLEKGTMKIISACTVDVVRVETHHSGFTLKKVETHHGGFPTPKWVNPPLIRLEW